MTDGPRLQPLTSLWPALSKHSWLQKHFKLSLLVHMSQHLGNGTKNMPDLVFLHSFQDLNYWLHLQRNLSDHWQVLRSSTSYSMSSFLNKGWWILPYVHIYLKKGRRGGGILPHRCHIVEIILIHIWPGKLAVLTTTYRNTMHLYKFLTLTSAPQPYKTSVYGD